MAIPPCSTSRHCRSILRRTAAMRAECGRLKKLPVIDVPATGMAADTVWLITDDFSDLGYVPYGDPLFYMLTVSRAVEYHDRNGALSGWRPFARATEPNVSMRFPKDASAVHSIQHTGRSTNDAANAARRAVFPMPLMPSTTTMPRRAERST